MEHYFAGMRIDRVTERSGDITEHIMRHDGKTLCGIAVWEYQEPCSNRPCQRCEHLQRRKVAKAARREA